MLLLLGCTEGALPSPTVPDIVGLSAAAPAPAVVLETERSWLPRLAITDGAGDTHILDSEGGLHAWVAGGTPTPVPDTAHLIDLTLAQMLPIGLSEDGTVHVGTARIATDHHGDGLLVGDRDSGLVAVVQGALFVVDTDTSEQLWEVEANALSGVAIGGGQVFDFDASQLQITARDARTGAVTAQRIVRPPHRSKAKGGKAQKSLGLTPAVQASPPGSPRNIKELRGALHYDPTTDRLFFRQLVLDGRTLQGLGHIKGIDGVLYADQSRIIAYRQGWDGTLSVMAVGPTTLSVSGRVPLLRPEGEAHIFYDPDTDSLTLSEPGRARLLRWNAPLSSP